MSRRYRKITERTFTDVRGLSQPQPNAGSLYIHLHAGRETIALPGVIPAGKAALAEALGWEVDAFLMAFEELASHKLAFADWDARLVFCPNIIEDNKPESPNVVKAWRKACDELPDCDLKQHISAHVEAYLKGLPQAFREAFHEDFHEHFEKAMPKASSIQEQEQEQKQEQKQEQEQEQKQEQNREPPSAAQPRPDDPAFTIFAEAFKRERHASYPSSRGDFVQLASLRQREGLDHHGIPQRWDRAIRNYFKTPQGKYRLGDLCVRYDVFLNDALDRFNKPASAPQGYRAFTGADWENDKYRHLINVVVEEEDDPRTAKLQATQPREQA